MSIKIDELQDILLAAGVKDQALRSAILKEAQALEDEKKEEKSDSKGPKAKNKFTVFIRCSPEHEKLFRDSAAFILKSPEEVPDENLTGLIKESAITQNRLAKKKGKIYSFADWFAFVKGKNRKEQRIVNTTKSPVQIIPLTEENINFN